jgi:hypothetical protein
MENYPAAPSSSPHVTIHLLPDAGSRHITVGHVPGAPSSRHVHIDIFPSALERGP